MSITPKGYRIDLEHPKLKEILRELTVKPFSVDGPVKQYKVFRKSEKYLYGPRFYMIDKLGLPELVSYHPIEQVNINISNSPRDYQLEPSYQVLDHILKNYSAVCSLYTGWGKTFLALWLAKQLGCKTLIVVHTRSLLDQWVVKIKEFTGIDAGIIQQDRVIVDSPICVGIIHSLCIRNYPQEVTQGFGFVVFDEVHHTPSEMFSGVFYKMFIKYSLGLSATLKRADGLSKVINWFLGETVVDIKQVTGKPDIQLCPFHPTLPFEEEVMINGKPNRMAMIVNMCNSKERNDFILDIINKNKHRVILVLTQIRNHAENLHFQLSNSGLYMGGMTLEQLNESNKKDIIIGTYNMASEGYDNPRLDTLLLATPKSDVEQAVGRILRKQNENPPLVIDIQDFYSTFTYSNYKRLNFYKKRGFLKQKEESIIDVDIRD